MANTTRNISMTGALRAEPPVGGGRTTTLMLDFCGLLGQCDEASVSIAGTELDPYVVPLKSITKIRMFALKILSGGPVILLLTSAAGIDQRVPVSNQLFFFHPSGDYFTNIEIVGTADIEYMLAGDSI